MGRLGSPDSPIRVTSCRRAVAIGSVGTCRPARGRNGRLEAGSPRRGGRGVKTPEPRWVRGVATAGYGDAATGSRLVCPRPAYREPRVGVGGQLRPALL